MGKAFQWILGLVACCVGFSVGAATPEIRALDPVVTDATISEITSGSLDSRFTGASFKEQASRGDVMWLRVASDESVRADAIPVVVVHAGMLHGIQVYAAGGTGKPLPPAAKIPEFAGARDTAFLLPAGAVYVRIAPPGAGYGVPRFAISTLTD